MPKPVSMQAARPPTEKPQRASKDAAAASPARAAGTRAGLARPAAREPRHARVSRRKGRLPVAAAPRSSSIPASRVSVLEPDEEPFVVKSLRSDVDDPHPHGVVQTAAD